MSQTEADDTASKARSLRNSLFNIFGNRQQKIEGNSKLIEARLTSNITDKLAANKTKYQSENIRTNFFDVEVGFVFYVYHPVSLMFTSWLICPPSSMY